MMEHAKPAVDLLEAPSPSAIALASGRGNGEPAAVANGAVDARVQKLFDIITAKSLVRNSQQKILSTQGAPLAWLIDLRKTFLDPVGLDLIAELFWERFADKFPFQVGGLEVGSVPLTSAIQLHGLKRGLHVNGFVVRKERKHYGLNKTYEGDLTDDPIVVVDDLLNSGGTVEKVRAVLAQAGRSVRDLFVVINYENAVGLDWVERNGVRFEFMYTLRQFGVPLRTARAPAKQSEFTAAWEFSASGGHFFDVLPGSTPALDRDRLYFGNDGGTFWALDQRTGNPAWNVELAHSTRNGIRSSPALHKDQVYFGSFEGNVYCLDTATGRERWRFTEADRIESSPCLAPDLDMLFIGLQHEVPGRAGSIAALHIETGAKLWEFTVEKPVSGSPAYDKELRLVACGTGDRELLLFEPVTRELQWRRPTGGEVKAAPAFDAVRRAVVVGAMDGSIRSIDLSGRERWRVQTGDAIHATPLVVGDRVYVGSADKNVYVINADNGRGVLKMSTTGKNYGSPRLIGGRIYFGSTSGLVYEFNPRIDAITGEIQLPERITNPIVHSAATGLFYARSYDGKIYAFRRVEEFAVKE
jgi:outer membrane protein assembly factor BamB